MTRSDPKTWLRRTVVLPSGAARDSADALYTALAGLAIGGLIAAAVAVLIGVAYLITGSLDVALVLLGPTAIIVVMMALVTSVHWLKLDATGIRLGRRAGQPSFVPWESVVSIRPATRREVVLDGWIWPPLPPREATRSLTSLGHYRIEYSGGRFYFPPSDPEEFVHALEHWRAVHDEHRGPRDPSGG